MDGHQEAGDNAAGSGRLTVEDNQERSRFEGRLGADLAVLIAYRRTDDGVALVHTETQEGFEHRGLAGEMVGQVLARLGADGSPVLPFCSFVKAYLVDHPDLISLVPERERESFGLT